MGWSTREVAELAGTSLRAVRHYHEVGLLEEPERLSNGYKQYRVRYLVRLLHLKRLTNLGFSLAQVAEMGEPDEHPAEALRQLDPQLKGTVERLQGVRAEHDGKRFRFGIFAGMYGEGYFQATARAWQELEAGDASAMRALAHDQTADAPDSAAAEALSPIDNALSAYLAVACNDSDWPEDVETYRQTVEEDREQHPLFGAAGANISPCAFWHHEPTEPTLPINSDGPQNVLIMQNLYDNATPHAGAVANREAFGDRARLVEVDALGHGVYVFGRNACALNIGTAYLVDGEMPEGDVFCETGDAQALDEEAQERRDNTLAELTW
jgi:DNA-binding transcriptional MerR regulator